MEKMLNELKVGDKEKVVKLKGIGVVKRRLLDIMFKCNGNCSMCAMNCNIKKEKIVKK